MHVLLACYQCDTGAGAEARGAVEWISGLGSAGVRITVLTRTPAGSVDPRISRMSGVDVVSLPGRGPLSLTDERALRRDYLRWDRAVRAWLDGHRPHRVDLAHHLSWGSLTAPTALAAASLPLVWGPLGGGQHCPLRLTGLLRPAAAGRELARGLRLVVARRLPWVRRTAAATAVALATNDDTARILRALGLRRVWMVPDTAVPGTAPQPSAPRGGANGAGPPRLVWLGRLEPHKAPVTAVRALRLLPEGVTLDIVGDGSEAARVRREIAASGLDSRVRMHGGLPHAAALSLLDGADATLFTSLRDSYGPVVLESLAHGVPVVALAHQGASSHPDDLVRRVPVGRTADLPGGFAREVRALLGTGRDGEEVLRARCRAYVEGAHLWQHRVERMSQAYREALA